METFVKQIILIATLSMLASAQQPPVATGQFPPAGSGPSATLVLLNQSSLPDVALTDIANALSRKVGNVALATRLAGIGTCGSGEWCMAVTDSMVIRGSEMATGAMIGAQINKEILRGNLQMFGLI